MSVAVAVAVRVFVVSAVSVYVYAVVDVVNYSCCSFVYLARSLLFDVVVVVV